MVIIIKGFQKLIIDDSREKEVIELQKTYEFRTGTSTGSNKKKVYAHIVGTVKRLKLDRLLFPEWAGRDKLIRYKDKNYLNLTAENVIYITREQVNRERGPMSGAKIKGLNTVSNTNAIWNDNKYFLTFTFNSKRYGISSSKLNLVFKVYEEEKIKIAIAACFDFLMDHFNYIGYRNNEKSEYNFELTDKTKKALLSDLKNKMIKRDYDFYKENESKFQ